MRIDRSVASILLLALTACAGTHQEEDPSLDPLADGPAFATVRGVVPDAWVVFSAEDGRMVEAMRADADGVAVTRDVSAAHVTVEIVQPQRELVTYAVSPFREVIAKPPARIVKQATFPVTTTVPSAGGVRAYGLEVFGAGESPTPVVISDYRTAPRLTTSVDSRYVATDGTATLFATAYWDGARADTGSFECVVLRHTAAVDTWDSTHVRWAVPEQVTLDVTGEGPEKSVDIEAVIDDRRGQPGCTPWLPPSALTSTSRRTFFVASALRDDVIVSASVGAPSPYLAHPEQHRGVIVQRRGQLNAHEVLDGTFVPIYATLDTRPVPRPVLRWFDGPAFVKGWVLTMSMSAEPSVDSGITRWTFVEGPWTHERARPDLPQELYDRVPHWWDKRARFRVEAIEGDAIPNDEALRTYAGRAANAPPPRGHLRTTWLEVR